MTPPAQVPPPFTQWRRPLPALPLRRGGKNTGESLVPPVKGGNRGVIFVVENRGVKGRNLSPRFCAGGIFVYWETFSVNVLRAYFTGFSARSLTRNVPDSDGVPEIVSPSTDSPAGRFCAVHVIAPLPVAESVML